MDIYEELVRWRHEGRRAALATIIGVRGSIPSFEAAKMLVRDDGTMAGSIGGGCVEAEVWQAAREVIEQGKPRTLAFNLNKNPKYDTGLVCGGSLEIFIEPLLPGSAVMDIYDELVRWRREGRGAALATIISAGASLEAAKLLVRDDGVTVGAIGGGPVEAEVRQAAAEVIAREEPRTLSFDLEKNPQYDTGLARGRSLETFIEPLLPVSTVYVFGAGHVGFNVYRVARIAGFEVVVIDDREAFANRERFPEARDVHADEFDKRHGTAGVARGGIRGHRHAGPPRRYAGSALGCQYSCALCRHDRFEAQGDYGFPRVGKGRHCSGQAESGQRSDWNRHRRQNAGRDRRLGCCRTHRRPPQLRRCPAPSAAVA